MRIEKIGKYRVMIPITTRNSCAICQIGIGSIIEITRVDYLYEKVIGPELLDWIHWELPVEEARG